MKDHLLNIFKFLLFLLVLPCLYAISRVFALKLFLIPQTQFLWLLEGSLGFLFVFLFVYNFKEVFASGQAVFNAIFSFIKPIAVALGYVVPVHAVILAVLTYALKVFGILGEFGGPALMAIAFFWTMHVVLSAQVLSEGDGHVLKGGYFLAFGISFLFHVVFAALIVAVFVPEFKLGLFFKDACHGAAVVYQSIYRLLFIPS